MSIVQNIWNRIYTDLRRIPAALAILAGYGISTQLVFGTVCPFAILTGFACPACGLTHAGLCLFTGQFGQAFAWNAAICVWAPLLSYLCLFRYVLGRKIPAALPLATLAGLLTLLYYVLRLWKGTLCPVPCEGIFPLVLMEL